jgi:GNAT superfamily N-acetyltransferase
MRLGPRGEHMISGNSVPFTPMFEIRTARVEDQDSIQQIYISAVGAQAAINEAQWDRLIQAGGFLVAQMANRIIGFGGIDVDAKVQLKWLYLLPQYQRAGIGSQLLHRLEAIGWAAGLSLLRLHSAPGAIEFYRRHGYKAAQTLN